MRKLGIKWHQVAFDQRGRRAAALASSRVGPITFNTNNACSVRARAMHDASLAPDQSLPSLLFVDCCCCLSVLLLFFFLAPGERLRIAVRLSLAKSVENNGRCRRPGLSVRRRDAARAPAALRLDTASAGLCQETRSAPATATHGALYQAEVAAAQGVIAAATGTTSADANSRCEHILTTLSPICLSTLTCVDDCTTTSCAGGFQLAKNLTVQSRQFNRLILSSRSTPALLPTDYFAAGPADEEAQQPVQQPVQQLQQPQQQPAPLDRSNTCSSCAVGASSASSSQSVPAPQKRSPTSLATVTEGAPGASGASEAGEPISSSVDGDGGGGGGDSASGDDGGSNEDDSAARREQEALALRQAERQAAMRYGWATKLHTGWTKGKKPIFEEVWRSSHSAHAPARFLSASSCCSVCCCSEFIPLSSLSLPPSLLLSPSLAQRLCCVWPPTCLLRRWYSALPQRRKDPPL